MQTKQRTAFTLTEVMVASTLLVAVMGTLAPLAIRCGQLWQESRHQQLAIDELANQLERLTLMDDSDRRDAINDLSLSAPLGEALPDATLSAELISDQHGSRIEMSLTWNRPGIPTAGPMKLVGWIDPLEKPTQSDEDPE